VVPTTEEHLIAAMREALTNAAKHARATRVDVVISLESGDVVLSVTDDGVGVDPTQSNRNSGLANLASRAHELGGTSQLDRVSESGGSRLTWRVPIT
jgi:signal transduction histidine kinase